jgi:hypothetical protein
MSAIPRGILAVTFIMGPSSMARATITTPGIIITTTQDLSPGGTVFATAHTTAGVLEWSMSLGRSRSTTDTGGTLAMDGGDRPGTARPIIGRPITVLLITGCPMFSHPFTIHRDLNRRDTVHLVEDRLTDDPLRYPQTIISMTNDPIG